MKPLRLRAILFDLDGTLADTLPICIEAFRRTVREHTGRELSPEDVTSRFGPTEAGMLVEFVGDDVRAAMTTYLAHYEGLHDGCPAPFAGLTTCLEELCDRGLHLGVVTGKGADSAAISLRVLGLAPFFSAVETGSPAGIVKADALERRIAAWNVDPREGAMVGDSPIDVRAALEAGVVAVGAAWSPTTNTKPLRAAGPHELFQEVAAFRDWALASTSA